MATPIEVTALSVAERFLGMKEVPGTVDNPAILAMLRMDMTWPKNDEVAWCSAFANYVAWLLDLPRSRSLAARSWLKVAIPTQNPEPGFDVVILKRGGGPGPEVIDAPGHVGFFAGFNGDRVLVLGGNQGDAVSLAGFPSKDVLGYRKLRV